MGDLAALNARFGIAGKLNFRENLLGLIVADVNNDHASASIALYGAQILSWTLRNAQPVIWMSKAAKYVPGKSLRGGVPICWPWFGPHPTNLACPAHGVARTALWDLVETRSLPNGATRLVLSLKQPNSTPCWVHPTTVEYRVDVGAALEIELVSANRGPSMVTIGQALHTYFSVGNIRQICIRGLEDCIYVDKIDGDARKKQMGAIVVSAETDRIYLGANADCIIEDPVMRRRIRIEKSGSRSFVVWNPWIDKSAKLGDMGEDGYLNMICVETTNADEDVIALAPGQEYRLWTRYQVETL
jgi:glucose-6-phosphate 1-epimerase